MIKNLLRTAMCVLILVCLFFLMFEENAEPLYNRVTTESPNPAAPPHAEVVEVVSLLERIKPEKPLQFEYGSSPNNSVYKFNTSRHMQNWGNGSTTTARPLSLEDEGTSHKKTRLVHEDGYIGTSESFEKRSIVTGFLFDGEGVADTRMAPIIIALVHDFSPFIEQEAKKRMLDPFNETRRCVVSPAIEREGDDIVTAFRVYKCPHRIDQSNTRNLIQKDMIFVQRYDRTLKPKGYGYFLGYGYSQFPENKLWDGPQDPRAFSVNGTVFLTFHGARHLSSSGNRAIIQPIMWDLKRNLPMIPQLANNPMHKLSDTFLYDKNWMPLNADGKLYFVQTLDPLLVMNCDLNASCHYINNVENVQYPFNWFTALRGGSQFQLYRWPYYIGAVHSLFRMNWNNYVYRAYGAHLVVFSMPEFRFVYSSGVLQIDNKLFAETTRYGTFMSDFFFPTSLLVETNDTVLLGGHINDDKAFLLRIHGIERLMNDVMRKDKEINPQAQLPKTDVIQSFFRSHFTQYYTNNKL